MASFAVIFLSGSAAAQQAYFSFEGDTLGIAGVYDFHFDLTRSVGSGEVLRFETFSWSGGTNAAGDTVPGSVINSYLDLLDPNSNSRGINDDGGSGLDSLLSWPGIAPNSPGDVPLNPDPLPAASYKLQLTDLLAVGLVPWSTDLVGPADAIQLTGASPIAATTDSLKFGTTGAGANLATYNHSSGSLDLLGELVLSPTGNSQLNLSGGIITAGGDVKINSGGSLTVSGTGNLTANSGFSVNGGSLTRSSGAIDMGAGQVLLATAGGQVDFTGNYTVNDDRQFGFFTGADFTVTDFLDVGNTTDGTLLVDGSGSTLTTNTVGATNIDWGLGGGTANVTIRNGATATIGAPNLRFALVGDPNSSGTLNVETGATMTVNNLNVATAADGTGIINVEDPSSKLTQNGVSTLAIGGSGTSTAQVNVKDSGTFSSGTGAITVNKSGEINIGTGGTNGTFHANGNVTLNGGSLTRTSGDFHLGAGLSLTAQDDAQLDFTGFYDIDDGTQFEIKDGADFTLTDLLDVGNGTDGTLIVDGAGSTLTTSTVSTTFIEWGLFGGTADVTVRNGATATIGAAAVYFAWLGDPNSSGTLNVQSGATMTVNSLDVATGAAGTGIINVEDPNTMLTQNGASTLTVGGSGSSTAELNVKDSGTFTSGTGTITVNKTGEINIGAGATGGTFNANGNMLLDGGSLTHSSGTFDLGAGLSLTAQDDAQINLTGGYNIDEGTQFEINGGADFTLTDYLDVGNGTNGTLIVDGVGSTLTTNTTSGFDLEWGRNGATANVTIRNGAAVTTGDSSIHFASLGDPNSSGTLNLQSGATMTTNFINLATAAAGTGIINIDDPNTSLTQNGASTLIIGGSGSSTAEVNLLGGTLTTGSGTTTVAASGTLNLDGGTLNATTIDHTSGGTVNFNAGILSVDTFNGTLVNDGGTLAPGSSPGVTNISVDYTVNSGALEIELAGNGALPGTDHDQVNVAGLLQLGGSLDYSLTDDLDPNGFNPGHMDTFIIATHGIRLDIFDSITDWDLGTGLVLGTFYDPNQIRTVAALPGDGNLDGSVDIGDFTLWGMWFGTGEGYGQGDYNSDGNVDIGDFTFWGGGFGSVPPPGPLPAPEPSTLLLAVVAAGGLLTVRQRSRIRCSQQ